MIDNPEQAAILLEKMEDNLPIPAIATKDLIRVLRQKNIQVPDKGKFQINKVVYLGNEGGICCGISPEDSEDAQVVSLTHLRIPLGHPLAKEIQKYQKKRIRKLARQACHSTDSLYC